MEIQTGSPTVNGRYVAFTADRIYKLWATPTIAVFHEGRWDIGRPVYAWLGPLPDGKIEDLWPLDDLETLGEIEGHKIGKSAALAMGYGGDPGRFEPLEYDL